MKRRVYCLVVRESLSPVGSLESFRATLTKTLSNDCCFWENRLNCEYVTLIRQTSSTRIAKHRSFFKLKFLQNFCSSCKTLADQVARNPRFYFTIYKYVSLTSVDVFPFPSSLFSPNGGHCVSSSSRAVDPFRCGFLAVFL
jgi:hypothetical protein